MAKPLFALPKANLLTKPWEYNRVYRQGKRLRGDNFTLLYLPADHATNRLGISIHGQLKGAAKRNRIKRIIKEFYRLNRDFIEPAKDIVLTVRKGFTPDSPAEVARVVATLLAGAARK